MNLREAVEAYANAVSSRDYYHVVGDGKREAESVARLAVCSQSLDVLLAVAEAAMAYAEYRADADRDAVNQLVCAAEHWRLWDAFWVARAKARNVNQS